MFRAGRGRLSMDVTLACPNCQRPVKAPRALMGKWARCANCGETFRLSVGQIAPPREATAVSADVPLLTRAGSDRNPHDVVTVARPGPIGRAGDDLPARRRKLRLDRPVGAGASVLWNSRGQLEWPDVFRPTPSGRPPPGRGGIPAAPANWVSDTIWSFASTESGAPGVSCGLTLRLDTIGTMVR